MSRNYDSETEIGLFSKSNNYDKNIYKERIRKKIGGVGSAPP